MSIFSEVWNSALKEEERETKPRDYLYASELGKAPVDVWLSLKGVEKSNPPNDRSKRKFESGYVWEWLVEQVLERSGILQESQLKNEYQYPDMLRVSGRIDFKIGGKVDKEKAEQKMQELEAINFPPTFIERGKRIVDHLTKAYPDGLEDMIIELKSVSAFMFEALQPRQEARLTHKLQCYHYLKANNIKKGLVVYICRDDCRLMEVEVKLGDKKLEEEYYNAIKLHTENYYKDEQPELEKPVVWDRESGKFSKNNNVAWSNYLTMLYGIKDQHEFDETYKSISPRWNRVIARMKEGKDMTKNNEVALIEMTEAGFDPEKLVPEFYSGNGEEE